jgi:hypothetical protein
MLLLRIHDISPFPLSFVGSIGRLVDAANEVAVRSQDVCGEAGIRPGRVEGGFDVHYATCTSTIELYGTFFLEDNAHSEDAASCTSP